MNRKRGYKRGYSLAILVGFEEDHAVLWRIFSRVVKQYGQLKIGDNRENKRALYNFHESVVDALRPLLEEGVRSIVATAPMKSTYVTDFFDHIQKHHAYLIQSKRENKIAFAELVGSAVQFQEVDKLVKTKEFRKLLTQTTSGEADHIVKVLEKQLFNIDNKSTVLYLLEEIENIIYRREDQKTLRNSYLILTNNYLSTSKDKTRIHRLLQISKNKTVKTLIVNSKTPAGKRINQFGGIVFFKISDH